MANSCGLTKCGEKEDSPQFQPKPFDQEQFAQKDPIKNNKNERIFDHVSNMSYFSFKSWSSPEQWKSVIYKRLESKFEIPGKAKGEQAMDQLMKQLLQGEIFWYETPPAPPVGRSAFMPYPDTPRTEPGLGGAAGCNNGATSGNVNKRMIEFLRKSWPTTTETKDTEKERCFRHMMNERMRREKQKRSYFELHSILPPGTKNDKNSIVQTATKRVQELEWLKKDLERRNCELQANLAAMNNDQNNEANRITVRIDNPTSGIDSMLVVLKCLKKLESKPRMIRSKFTNQEFLAVLDVETEIRAAEVEKAINRTLQEAERKLQGR